MSSTNKTNIYLFHGPDTFRALNTLNEWKNVFLKKHGSGSVRVLEKPEQPLRVSELAGGNSLFNATTLTIIKDPFANDQPAVDADDFLNFLTGGSLSGSNHILLWQRGALDRRLGFTKKIAELNKAGKIKIYHFEYLNEEEALKFFARELKGLGLSIKKDAGELLFKYLATPAGELDSWTAAGPLKQLAAYCQGPQVVTTEAVQKVVVPSRDEDVFLPLLQSFSKKDHQSFLSHLNTLTQNAESEPELLGIISALFEQVKNMILVLHLTETGKSLNQMDEELNFKSGRARYLLADAKRFKLEKLYILLDKLLAIEYNVKKGKVPLPIALAQIVR